jgi:hypothetical protein
MCSHLTGVIRMLGPFLRDRTKFAASAMKRKKDGRGTSAVSSVHVEGDP